MQYATWYGSLKTRYCVIDITVHSVHCTLCLSHSVVSQILLMQTKAVEFRDILKIKKFKTYLTLKNKSEVKSNVIFRNLIYHSLYACILSPNNSKNKKTT